MGLALAKKVSTPSTTNSQQEQDMHILIGLSMM
jgi:hypothetical protein